MNLKSILLQMGGILLVAGAILPMVPPLREWAAVTFSAGALLFGSMQLLDRYDGPNFVIRRLRRQQILGAFALMIAAALLVMKTYGVGPVPIRGDEWKIALIVAAILELYTAFRIPQEMEKESRK